MLTGVFAAGPQHACAVTGSGTLECWGDGTDGDLGNGMTSQSNAPVPVNGVTNVTKLALGAAHTCALEQSGALYCWGLNSSGQLGNASMQEASSPVPVSGFDAGAIVDVVAGIQHTCALVQAGAVYCWGDNSYGQLGQGNFDLANSATPLLVPSLSSGVTQISAGYQHTCALRRGRVLCWGFNTAGALGNNTTLNSPTPGDVIEP
jgi:alpha-tubulin suppressor-like RCC1 family protein